MVHHGATIRTFPSSLQHNLKPQTVTRPVTPYDIAPTLSGYLDVSAPSGATGVMLEEVFQD